MKVLFRNFSDIKSVFVSMQHAKNTIKISFSYYYKNVFHRSVAEENTSNEKNLTRSATKRALSEQDLEPHND